MSITLPKNLIVRHLGRQPYQPVWDRMRDFTQQRTEHSADELWLVEHPAVFTQGLAGKSEHILNPHAIPIVQTDRGGQVTYHGPGQLVAYPLLNLNQNRLTIRRLVTTLEKTLISVLAHFSIPAESRCDAPGVYVQGCKIASIGLRVRRGCSYHGVALNVNMDLAPFSYINPCGFRGLAMTQIRDFAEDATVAQTIPLFVAAFLRHFEYTGCEERHYEHITTL